MVRFKNRYLVLELTWKDGRVDENLNETALLSITRDSIQQIYGDYGLGSALASFQVKYFNPATNICMIRCSRDEYRQVWCAMTLITQIRNRLCSFRLLHVTGDVKKCVELSRKCDEAVLASRTLKKQHVAMAEEAGKRLEQIDL